MGLIILVQNEITLKHDSIFLFEAKLSELLKPIMNSVLAIQSLQKD